MGKLNIRSDSSDWRGRILSNLADTPFWTGGFLFRCVEAPLQGIKFRDPLTRKQVFAMSGIDALREGRQITLSLQTGITSYIYWNGEVAEYGSLRHRLLIAIFIREKIRQNPEVQRALLATAGTFIFHDIGRDESPHTSLPEEFYIEVLLAERRLLKKLLSLGTN